MNQSVKITLDYKLDTYLDNILNECIKGNQVIIESENTKNITKTGLNKLLGSNVIFRVSGGLNKEKYNSEKYYNRTVYAVGEMRSIISSFEDIESRLHGSDMQKAKDAFEYLSKYMETNHNYKQDTDRRASRSLLSLTNRSAICCGHSLIYKELMDRLNIDCDYVRGGTTREEDAVHAWNVLHIDNQTIPVDLTWECTDYHNGLNPNFKYFGSSENFIKKHFPESDEREQSYKYSMTYEDVKIKLNIKEKEQPKTYLVQRKDGTSFHITNVGMEDGLFKYAVEEVITANVNGVTNKYYSPTSIVFSDNDINKLSDVAIDVFANDLFARNRIISKASSSNSYMGLIAKNENGVYQKYNKQDGLDRKPLIKNSYLRKDGTYITVEYNYLDVLDDNIYSYETYEYIHGVNGTTLKENKIYSNSNLININDQNEQEFVASEFLDSDKLDRLDGRYIGSYYYNKNKYGYTEDLAGGVRSAR